MALSLRAARRRPGIEHGVVVEWLVMELKERVGTVGIRGPREGLRVRAGRARSIGPPWPVHVSVRVRPPPRVPRPVDACGIEPVPDPHRPHPHPPPAHPRPPLPAPP